MNQNNRVPELTQGPYKRQKTTAQDQGHTSIESN